MDLPKFEGRMDKRNFNEFLKELYRIGNLFGWTESRCCQVLPICLRGEALATYEALPENTKGKWRILTTEMAKIFMKSTLPQFHRAKLQNSTQTDGESIAEFGNKIRDLVKLAFPEKTGMNQNGFSKGAIKELETQYFLNGLKTHLKAQILRKVNQPASLEEAIELAVEEENLQQYLRESQIRDGKIITAEIASI